MSQTIDPTRETITGPDAPLDNTPADANVDKSGHCILMNNDPEQARPDTGAPCDDGRDAQ